MFKVNIVVNPSPQTSKAGIGLGEDIIGTLIHVCGPGPSRQRLGVNLKKEQR